MRTAPLRVINGGLSITEAARRREHYADSFVFALRNPFVQAAIDVTAMFAILFLFGLIAFAAISPWLLIAYLILYP